MDCHRRLLPRLPCRLEQARKKRRCIFLNVIQTEFRLKYPHLVQGAVASSGPVNAKPDFPEYLEVVRAALDSEDGGQCDQAVRTAVARVQYLTQHR